jgi:uncharacterized membrane protein HdeD (DUF308 family)
MKNSINKQLSTALSRTWWMLLLRGVAAIVFGTLLWVMPGLSLTVLVLLFGGFAFVDGILGCWIAVAGRKDYEDWWVLLLWGLVGLGAGIMTFLTPDAAAVALVFLIAAWSIATGILEIVLAIRLRREIEGEWLLLLGGLASVLLGVILFLQPGAGALALVWVIGAYTIIHGLDLIVLAFRTRRIVKLARESSQS